VRRSVHLLLYSFLLFLAAADRMLCAAPLRVQASLLGDHRKASSVCSIEALKGYVVPDPQIRVLLVDAEPSVRISASAFYQILSDSTSLPIVEGLRLTDAKVSAGRAGLVLNGRSLRQTHVRFTCVEDGGLWLNGKCFRGEFEVVRAGGNVSVANIVGVEEYVAGVLGAEMPLGWAEEALKAQAVCSRSYALYKKIQHIKDFYDVAADVRSQVYRGVAGETAKALRVVQATRGQVLMESWRIAPAYFHSTCSGYTANASLVMGDAFFRCLSGVRCGYCNQSPFHSWTYRISKRDLGELLRKAGCRVQVVKSVRATKTSEHGYVLQVEVRHSGGTLLMKPSDFRSAVGSSKLRSTAFTVRDLGSTLLFRGKGYGHGVGMCQWGAYGMARQGKNYVEILRRYFPSAKIVELY